MKGSKRSTRVAKRTLDTVKVPTRNKYEAFCPISLNPNFFPDSLHTFFLSEYFVDFFDLLNSSAFCQRSIVSASKGTTWVTEPMPLVRPSRNRIRVPTLIYSGFRMNLDESKEGLVNIRFSEPSGVWRLFKWCRTLCLFRQGVPVVPGQVSCLGPTGMGLFGKCS